MANIAIILAGGNGTRFESTSLAKQYNKIGGMTIFAITLCQFLYHKEIDFVLPVINSEHTHLYEGVMKEIDKLKSIKQKNGKILQAIFGGNDRLSSSIYGWYKIFELSISGIIKHVDKILVHDVVRPFVSSSLISDVLKALDMHDIVDVGIDLIDTIKYKINTKHFRYNTLNREHLYATQTPQGMRYNVLKNIYINYKKSFFDIEQSDINYTTHPCKDFTDDINFCISMNADLSLGIVNGISINKKITYLDDLLYAKFLINNLKRTRFFEFL